MSDWVERKRSDGRYPQHPCAQESLRVQRIAPSTAWHDWNTVTADAFPLEFDPPTVANVVPDVPVEALSDLGRDAFIAFETPVPTEISIANFLWELRELKDLIPKISDNIFKTANDGFLNYSFGWKPFLSDIKKLSGLSKAVEKRLKFLRDSYGKPTKLHFFRGDVYKPPSMGVHAAVESLDGIGWPNRYFVLEDYRADFRAGATLLQKLEGLHGGLAKLQAFNAALGLDNPTKIIWNAIPYSFVVDWFTQIGSELDRAAFNTFEGHWDLSRLSHSVSISATVGVWARPRPAFGNAATKHYEVKLKRYRRSASLPVMALSFNALTPNQQALFASLLGSKVAK